MILPKPNEKGIHCLACDGKSFKISQMKHVAFIKRTPPQQKSNHRAISVKALMQALNVFKKKFISKIAESRETSNKSFRKKVNLLVASSDQESEKSEKCRITP